MTELLVNKDTDIRPDVTVEVDEDPELATTVQIMEKLHASEVFHTPEQSKEFLDSLDYADFKKFISLVNGVEREIPVPERGQVSSSFVQSRGVMWGTQVDYRPPHKTMRDDLLKLAFEKAQQVESPELAGLTLGLSINAIHYFEDGNGRTARMVYSLLTEGYDGSKASQARYTELLENTKGREVVNLNPMVSGLNNKIHYEMFLSAIEHRGYKEALGNTIPTYLYDAYPDALAGEEDPNELAVSDDIDAIHKQKLFEAIENGPLAMVSLMAALPPERIQEFVKKSPNTARVFVDASEFLPTLTAQEIEEWWVKSQHVIAAYVRRVIKVADRADVEEIAARYKPKSTAE